MEVSKDLFIITTKNKDEFILYQPVKGEVLGVNGATIKQLQKVKNGELTSKEINNDKTLTTIKNIGGIVDKQEIVDYPEIEFSPTKLTVFTTSDCNLNCVYCYNRAGENPKHNNLENALLATDFIIDNAIKKNEKYITINFHGGGEPLLWSCWDFLTEYVSKVKEKAKDNNIKAFFRAGTNGVFNPIQREWIKNNINQLTVSLDGPEDIQNMQRPLANGKGSFKAVMKTIEYFRKNNVDFSLRPTISELSVRRMPEIVDFFVSLGLKEIHLEPLYECGRCATTDTKAPDPMDFANYMIKAKERGKELGVKVMHGCSDLYRTTTFFCGVTIPSFNITPEGDISACFEVTRRDDPRKNEFFYGTIENNKLKFNYDKIKQLQSRRLKNLPGCNNCITAYHCGGDCAAKAADFSGTMMDTSKNTMCEANRHIMLYNLEEKIRGG